MDVDFLNRALEAVLPQPTAPYHEERVARAVMALCREMEQPVEPDEFGNLFARYEGGSGPLTILSAHMDHPGLEILGEENGLLRAVLLGGLRADLLKGTAVRVIQDGDAIPGVIEGVGDEDRRRSVWIRAGAGAKAGDFAVLDLPGLRLEGDLIHTRAADDLIGCVVVLSVLRELRASGAPHRVWGLFSRAEEDTCTGATALARSRRIPFDASIICIETSRAMPSAEIGKGAVVRVGDKMAIFDAELELVLSAAASDLAKEKVPVQRMLMPGGYCEASVYFSEGYRTMGVSIPLGNYHNNGEDRLKEEFVSLRDVQSAVLLIGRFIGKLAAFDRKAVLTRGEEHLPERMDRLRRTANQAADRP